jgi:YidC/Oxa1 family membrane protein insertase
MALYKETGTNPFASCMPLILQMPIFFALFRLIDYSAKDPEHPRGLMTPALAHSFANAKLLGAPISESFASTDVTGVKILAGFLVVLMCATTFLTQRQLMSKNMPADAMTGQFAQQQKMLLYVLPFVFVISGVAFPIGVLFYWTTSNLWTMGQQFYVIRNNPVPGTPAAKAKQERDAAKLARKGESDPTYLIDTQPDTAVGTGTPATPQRQQPKRQSRSQRKKQGPPRAKPAQPTQDQQDEGDERGRNSA